MHGCQVNIDGQMYVNMKSSKGIHICHHIHRFIRKSLVLKNTHERIPDVRNHVRGEEENMAKSVGGALLTVETLKNFS